MDNSISNTKTLLKYIDFLADYSESLLSEIFISKEKYEDLIKESELFCKRIINSSGISDNIKKEFIQNKLPNIKQRFSLVALFESMIKKSMSEQNSYDDVEENRRRKNIKAYLDKMRNLYLLIKAKSNEE